MTTKNINNIKYRYLFAAILVSVATIFVVMCTIYIGNLRRIVRSENNRYLKEISEHVASFVNYRIQVCYENLESIGDTYNSMMNTDKADKDMKFLKDKAERNNYLWIGIIDMNGINHMTNGQVIDMSYLPSVRKVLSGERVTASVITPMQENTKSILHAIPLYNENNEIVGALSACNKKEVFRELCDINIFGGEGFTYIIDSDGDFVVDSKNKNACSYMDNFFEMMDYEGKLSGDYSVEDMKDDMDLDRTGMLYYELNNGLHKAMTYISLDVEGWYLLAVVPTNVTGAKTNTFVKYTVTINILIVVLFVILLLIIMMSENKNRRNLEKVAFIDPITGGYNSSKFEMEAEKWIKDNNPYSYVLVSLDIQKFKLINESFGSEAGNNTLAYVHNVIRDNLIEGECVARITADTFNILMKNTGKEKIVQRLDDITKKINSYNDLLDRKYFLTIHDGVYIIDDPTFNMITIQDRANVARKNNKNVYLTNKNVCAFYDDVERERLVREKEIDNSKESALENKEFVIYLQPKVELENNSIAGAEALVRWQNSERGIISPGEFIPAFEKSGFIVELDLYVFEEVCKVIENWISNKKPLIPISVNLSRIHFNDLNFVENYKRIFDKYNIPPEYIEFEFTETLVFENVEILIDTIGRFHDIGFSCSLDDFGSGYSSLNLLKDIPVDVLKLDGAFFKGKNDDKRREEYVVESVIDIARKLNMKTVSEGVELNSQVEFLKKAKCDMIQGYVFFRPMPVDEFESLALKNKNC